MFEQRRHDVKENRNQFIRLERWRNRPGVYALRDLPTGQTQAIFDAASFMTLIEDFAKLVAEDFPGQKIFELIQSDEKEGGS